MLGVNWQNVVTGSTEVDLVLGYHTSLNDSLRAKKDPDLRKNGATDVQVGQPTQHM